MWQFILQQQNPHKCNPIPLHVPNWLLWNSNPTPHIQTSKNMNLASPTHQKFAFLFFSQLHITFFSPHPFAPLKAPHQSSPRIMIHIAHQEYPLSSQNQVPSLKLTHQSRFHNNLQNNKLGQKFIKTKKLYDVLETPQLRQLCHRVELEFLLSSTKNVWHCF